MTTRKDTFWQTKLHARLHDPAEKALVLLRDPEGHEGGTSRVLHRDLGFHKLPVRDWLQPEDGDLLAPDNPDVLDGALFKKGIPVTMYRHVKRADWWAAAADRPQWPMEEISVKTDTGVERSIRVAPWARVRWSRRPVLIHPLTGEQIDLRTLAETGIGDIKKRSREHFSALTLRDGDSVDWNRTLLAFWRFGPELREESDGGKLGELWPLLPADTRVPDHSIWDHLDLTSAFAGAFAGDRNEEAGLFALSIGPVQKFIAAARTTSDLWAGSHLLSRLSWEAMKVVCEDFGPDAILFPRLRGLPQVDVWLRDERQLPTEWFEGCDWTKQQTDANPLFAAALPNRFVAIIPRSQAGELAGRIERRVRGWLQDLGKTVVTRLLEAADDPTAASEPATEDAYCRKQMMEQIDGFPEINWSAAPFSLIRPRNAERDTDLDTTALADAMSPFYSPDGTSKSDPGFLGSPAWNVLQKDATLDGGATFFAPNPGALYPAVQELAERVLAAAKAGAPFAQTEQNGWRCSLTGETEWLTTDPDQLLKYYGSRDDTLWSRVSAAKPAWAKPGEHLGAMAAIKRLWPSMFAEEVARVTGLEQGAANRFVVSTHTMALAGNLEQLDHKLKESGSEEAMASLLANADRPPALPRGLAQLRNTTAARIPAALDRLRDSEDGEQGISRIETEVNKLLGHKPEAYYALLLMDGDRMGRILSGGSDECRISYLDSFHPDVRMGFKRIAERSEAIRRYGNEKRAMSPNRHFAISGALNDFAVSVVPRVLEHEHRGRVIYAGGDDVMAMLPVVDLIPAMLRLRHAYSGHEAPDSAVDRENARARGRLVFRKGFARLPGTADGPGRLLRMMGAGATASCGAVIAHHQAPLGAVLRELRAAEQRAKYEGGRNAFSISIIKRGGGDLRLTTGWSVDCEAGKGGLSDSGTLEPAKLLLEFAAYLGEKSVSRRAVYHSVGWMRDLPDDADAAMLGNLLGYQLARQTPSKAARDYHDVPGLARRLAQLACGEANKGAVATAREWLGEFLGVAEFLAREVRGTSTAPTDG